MNGKRPDGCTLIPWRGGKPLAWDVTVCTTVADSYLTAANHAAAAVAEQAADRKCLKYADLSAAYEFQHLRHMGHLVPQLFRFWILEHTGEPLEVQFFIPADQCLGSKIQLGLSQIRTMPTRSHSILFLCVCHMTRSHSSLFLLFVFNCHDLYYLGVLKSNGIHIEQWSLGPNPNHIVKGPWCFA